MDETELLQRIGWRVYELRDARNLGQKEFGAKVGVGALAISRLERGVIDLHISQLAKIAEFCNLSLADFFDLPERKDYSERQESVKTVLRMLNQYTHADVKDVIEVIRGFFNVVERAERRRKPKSKKRRKWKPPRGGWKLRFGPGALIRT